MTGEEILKELEAHYGHKFEWNYINKIKSYKQLAEDIQDIIEKRHPCQHLKMNGSYCMDCGWDSTGNYH